MATNDTPDLAGLEGKEIENLTTGMTAATEAGLGLISSLTNISNLLESMARNPLLSIGTFTAMSYTIDRLLISRLKDMGVYTKQLDELIQKNTRSMAAWTGVMGTAASALYSVGNAQIQLLKSTREISRFATMENLPGGAGSLPAAAAQVKYLEAQMGMKYTSEFARNYINQYSQLFSQLQKGTNVKAIQDIVGLYSYQTGIDVAGIASNLLSNYRGIGLTGTGAIQAVIQPMMQQMTSRFAYGSIDQVMNTFLSMFQKQIGLTGGDVNTAYQQSLALMKGLGKDFGLNEMLQLQNLYLGPGRTNELIKRGVVIPGVDLQQVQQVQGGPGGLINTIDLIQQSARSLVLQNAPQLRGTNLQESLQGKTYTDVFTTLSGRKIFETFVEMIGITPEFALSLARMKDINTNIKDIVGSMENLNISTDKFIETVSSNVTTKAIERSADLSTSLLDTISNWMLERRTDVGKIAADLGIEPSVIEGAGASLLVGTVLWSFLKKWGIYRGATKKPRMMGGMALPVIGAMDIMREAHEGGDMGQGLMNVATDVATFSLMSKIFGGGKHTGDIPKTATKATRLGRFAKFGRFGLPVIAGGIVLNQLLETSRPVEEAPVPEYAKIYGEEEEPSLEDLVPLSKYLEAIQYRDKRKKLYDKEKKSYIREGVSSKDTENEPLLMYNSRGELERGREKSYFKGGMSSENLEDVLNRGKLENSIENISALSKRTMNEGLKRKAKETGIPEMLDKGDFGTLNIVVTTPDGETIASEAMKQGETKRIMINLKGVLA